ncbi:Peroxidase mlt-7, partial [Frankliniella fusca]
MFRSGNKAFGSDLAAVDIERGREHGLPGYNAYRQHCGLRRARTFQQFNDTISSEVRGVSWVAYPHGASARLTSSLLLLLLLPAEHRAAPPVLRFPRRRGPTGRRAPREGRRHLPAGEHHLPDAALRRRRPVQAVEEGRPLLLRPQQAPVQLHARSAAGDRQGDHGPRHLRQHRGRHHDPARRVPQPGRPR